MSNYDDQTSSRKFFNPWVKQKQTSPEDMRKAMDEFKNRGGEILIIPENYKEDNRLNSSTAVKIGFLAQKLRALKK